MKRIISTAACMLLVCSCLTAQIPEFEKWVKHGKDNIAQEKFSRKGLDKAECQRAAEIIDSLWLSDAAERLRKEWGKLILSGDSIELACACRTFGLPPRDGRSLYISLHGGGECSKETNDEQWMNQIYLYEPSEGIYVAPRAPWNTWDLWHKEGLDGLLEKLIQACVVFEGVNPNKVYILGYSAGGDGVWRLAPRMADKWAAAAMMAGHPGNTSLLNLLNLPFTIWMGAEDSAYDRNRLAAVKAAALDSLAATVPGKYIHSTNILQGKGHWMENADAEAIAWMSQYRRNPYPETVVWRQEEVTREHFYWLSAPADELQQGKTIEVSVDGNTININRCDYSSIKIYLNDRIADLDKKVTVCYKGKRVFKKRVKRTIADMYNSLNTRGDRSYSFPCVIEIETD